MSKIIYKFLNESFLFQTDYIETTYIQVTDTELKNELRRYREYCINNINSINSEINLYKNDIKFFSAKELIDIPRLIQTAFYIDQITLPDPIFEYSYEHSQFSNVFSQMNGITDITINRSHLAKSAKCLKEFSPMVEAGYIKFFPVSYLFEPESEIPLISPTASTVLPENIMKLYCDSAEVKSFTRNGQHITVDKEIQLRRDIMIKFDLDSTSIFGYQLMEPNILNYDETNRTAQIAMKLSSNPLSIQDFNNWVSQSVYRSALNHYQDVLKELQLANTFKSQYLTHSSFIGNLLNCSTDKKIQTFTSECILNFDLHFFKDIDIQTLMSIRQNDGEEFAVFRRELEKQFRGLRTEQNPDTLRSKIADVTHEITEVQIANLDLKVKNLKKGVLANIGIGILGLGGVIATSGISLLATAYAGINGYKTYAEYQQKVRENPSFFLWKVKKEGAKKKNKLK